MLNKIILAYDSDCGPCTSFRNAVGFLDAHRRMDFMSLNKAEEEGLLDSIPTLRRHRSFHLIFPDGGAFSGAKAIPVLAGLLPSGRITSKLMTLAPGGLTGVAFVYGMAS